ncbi:MAG: endonuclease NucS [Phormidesmis sp. CAN_BIN36]|nr:endonuclease NucS [Phormidesmis sp. CAN_BIN36]
MRLSSLISTKLHQNYGFADLAQQQKIMPEAIRIWSVEAGQLKEIPQTKLDLESRLEIWLENDISILSNDLLVIGRQVQTAYGGFIDLLCLDRQGNIIIIELKRDKTAREVVAQSLDYASWIKTLSYEELVILVDRYLGKSKTLDEAFIERFGTELPEVLMEDHQIVIVAAEIDSSSERIIRYLSETYGVRINAATFQFFSGEENQELLARTFLIEPTQVEIQSRLSSKKKPNLTIEQLEQIADANSVGSLYLMIKEKIAPTYFWWTTTQTYLTFTSKGKKQKAILNLSPSQSSSSSGLMFGVYRNRLAEYLGIAIEQVDAMLPMYNQVSQESEVYGSWGNGFFKNESQINLFLDKLDQLGKEL